MSVGGKKYLDLEYEAVAMLAREQGVRSLGKAAPAVRPARARGGAAKKLLKNMTWVPGGVSEPPAEST